jgi:hypothetical protein
VVIVLFVAAAGDVVLKDTAQPASFVETGEQRHDHQTLHRSGEVAADHLREFVGLALERQALALDLLVVLELGLEQANDLDRRTGGARYRHRRHVVGREHLLDRAMGDLKPFGGPAITGHDDALGETQSEHGGPLGSLHSSCREVGARDDFGPVVPHELGERGPGAEQRRAQEIVVPGFVIQAVAFSANLSARRRSSAGSSNFPEESPECVKTVK